MSLVGAEVSGGSVGGPGGCGKGVGCGVSGVPSLVGTRLVGKGREQYPRFFALAYRTVRSSFRLQRHSTISVHPLARYHLYKCVRSFSCHSVLAYCPFLRILYRRMVRTTTSPAAAIAAIFSAFVSGPSHIMPTKSTATTTVPKKPENWISVMTILRVC